MSESVQRIQPLPRTADEPAVARVEGMIPHPGAQNLSPELVLVDPVVAASARSALPEPTDTLSYLTSHPLPASAMRPSPSVDGAPKTARQKTWALPRRRLTRTLAALAAFGAVVVALLLSDIQVELGQPSEAADPNASAHDDGITARPPNATPSTPPGDPAKGGTSTPRTKQAPRKGERAAPPPPGPSARRFAWAPADGASGYRFELFRASSRVFAAETSRPELTLPASWSEAGARRALEPGEYRWYVWPVVAGRRAAEAIVQAKLVVPRR